MNVYGPFAPIVSYAVSGLAAISAILFAWKHRARWEPSEEDVPAGGQKVAAVMALVALVYTLITVNRDNVSKFLLVAVIVSVLLLLSLLIYIFLIATCTYDGRGAKKVIGGLWTTDFAKREITANAAETVQGLFRREKFEKDRIWPRTSQAASKVLFVAAYVGMILSGTVAVTIASAIVAARSTQPSPLDRVTTAVAPLDNTTGVAGFAKLRWTFARSEGLSNLRYEVETETNGHAKEIAETRQNVSIRLEPGVFRWRVRAIWDQMPSGQDGVWTNWQAITVYKDTLERIKATKRLRIGETQGYQRTNRLAADGRPENFWTVWIPDVFSRDMHVEVVPEIVVSRWTDDTGRNTYFRLFDEDPSIDLLASGLTILPDRERDYGIRFTKPIGTYRALLVSRKAPMEIKQPVRLAAIAQTTEEQYARQLVRSAPATWRFDEPDASITGSDAYSDILKALESDRVDAVIIDQPYAAVLQRDSTINLKVEYLQTAVDALQYGARKRMLFPQEEIGVATRIEDDGLRELLSRYSGLSSTQTLWRNFFPTPPE
jgi:hypothetical protein